ncbi:MAG: B12-binding domain-containing radical SAM protein [Candidatus Muirbacterium halophilum]|nr:B12-binding domain-containing radical SAM protein [Candidatus Muirbacterium halophilum]MCK9474667.1 B12-binding domain-containing radical SAM protein [Candidatus Muirbacterium halophilum]
MKILLINPPVDKIIEPLHDSPEYMHVGLAHLYSSLKKFTNTNVSFIDCKFLKKDKNWLLNKIKNTKPDIVGFTAKTLEIDNVLYLCKEIKKICPCKIIIGGPHATGDFEYIIKNENVDFVGISEFETGFIMLINALIENKSDFSHINSLVWKKNNKIIKNRVLSCEKKHIGRVLWEDFPKASKYYIMAIRGCPQRCIFCMRVLGNIPFYREINEVIDEIEIIYKVNPQALIEFGDETFTLNSEYITKLKDELKKRNLIYGKKGFIASTRIDKLNLDIIKKLKSAGFKKLIVGIESGDKHILELCKKDIDIKKALKVSKYIRQSGILLECNFMVGLPGENFLSIIKTALIASRLRANSISVSIACPYPGTELYKMCKKNKYGLKLISSDYIDFNNELGNALEHENFSRKSLEIAQLFIYIFSYLGSLRFKEFLVFCHDYRKEAISYLKHFFKKDLLK